MKYGSVCCIADMVKQMQAFQSGGPWVQARNFAVLTGVGAGLTVAIKRIRGKEDVYSTCVLAHIKLKLLFNY